jgi:predicted NUDIX family phosphoesterase
MEKILCLKRAELPSEWLPQKDFIRLSESDFFKKMEYVKRWFVDREEAETDFSYKQLIPYIVVLNARKEVLFYKRRGSENRLKNLYSVGIGGHINEEDRARDLRETVYNGMIRELGEETGLQVSEDQLRFCGLINEEVSKIGKTHLGLVYLLQGGIKKSDLNFNSELRVNAFVSISGFLDNFTHEYWSELALRLIEAVEFNGEER